MYIVFFNYSHLNIILCRLVLFGLVALLFPITCLGQATTCTCGIPQTTKIVGGVAAQLHQFPWQVIYIHSYNLHLRSHSDY